MPSAHLTLREEDVVRLTLEFLHNRDLHISQLSVERETGVINGNYSDDVLFLRQLILDGQWDDVLEFIQPLEALQSFDMRKFCYTIMTHKYVELLCIKSEAVLQGSNVDNAVEEVVKVLNDLEKYAPTKEEYSTLCLLLTLPRLNDHALYKDWNPSNARVKCFREVFPLVEPFLPGDRKTLDQAMGTTTTAKNDRLIQLIIKGILYESCVNYCQAKATGSKESLSQEMSFSRLLDGSVGFSDSDLSLLSWLQSIPPETFSVPFEQRTLNVDVERLERPSLETSWTEHMLVTPIKPKTFPHSAMPFTRPRSAADVMSRSLHPAFDGLSSGLGGSPAHVTNPRMMALSTGDISTASPMTRSSFASFHLSGSVKSSKLMNSSVDRLFENENEVFLSSSYAEFQQLPSIIEQSTPKTNYPPSLPNSNGQSGDSKSLERIPAKSPLPTTPEHQKGGRESPASTSTNRSSRRDSLSEKTIASAIISGVGIKQQTTPSSQQFSIPAENHMDNSYNGDLLKEYQRQKQRVQEQITAKEREREELIRQQINHHDNRLIDDRHYTSKIPVRDTVVIYHHASKESNPMIPPVKHSTKFLNAKQKTAVNGVPSHPLTTNHHHHHHPSTSPNPPIGDTAHLHLAQPLPPPATHQLQQSVIQNGTHAKQQQIMNHVVSHEKIPGEPHYETVKTPSQKGVVSENDLEANGGSRPRFIPVTSLEDVQAVRCAEFHPGGQLYAVGSNSKTLRICAYPKLSDIRNDHQTYQPTVLFKRTKHHKGSIYCLAWSPMGDLLATGSNDKTVKLMRFNSDTSNLEGQEVELTMHDGTIRDLCFIEDSSNKSSLLISGGAGDCKIYVTDCETGTPFQALSGHSGHVLSLYNWGGAIFVSGSQDKSVRFWDLRTRGCVNVFTPSTVPGSRQGSGVASLCVESSGRLLVSGHEDGCCALYDIRGSRPVQCFKPHAADVRSTRFSPSAYYLLTAGYDNKLVLTDLQGDLTMALPSVVVAQHQDKVISGRWHPTEFSFISTSADKTATLWALPPF